MTTIRVGIIFLTNINLCFIVLFLYTGWVRKKEPIIEYHTICSSWLISPQIVLGVYGIMQTMSGNVQAYF